MLDDLGEITQRADHPDVIEHYHQALTLHRAHGFTYAEANSLDRLGQAHLAHDRHDQARTAWREALALYREQGRDIDATRVQRQLDDLDNRGRDGGQPSQNTGPAVSEV